MSVEEVEERDLDCVSPNQHRCPGHACIWISKQASYTGPYGIFGAVRGRYIVVLNTR